MLTRSHLSGCKRGRAQRSAQCHSCCGFKQAVETVKSLIITLALMDKQISVKQAVELSSLEQEYQVSVWGNVEWYHGMDLLEMQSRLAAASLFMTWCCESSRSKKKIAFGNVT
ncbi:hypothetical protein ScPMuIL_004726 [Solemya velum]